MKAEPINTWVSHGVWWPYAYSNGVCVVLEEDSRNWYGRLLWGVTVNYPCSGFTGMTFSSLREHFSLTRAKIWALGRLEEFWAMRPPEVKT